MKNFKLSIALLILAVSLSGCAMLRTLLPGGPTLADAEWEGIKSGEVISIVASLDPRVDTTLGILEQLGQSQTEALGVMMPVSLIGSAQPRWILCVDELIAKCKAIPLNAKVHFAGSPIGNGLLWKPSRLTAENFDD